MRSPAAAKTVLGSAATSTRDRAEHGGTSIAVAVLRTAQLQAAVEVVGREDLDVHRRRVCRGGRRDDGEGGCEQPGQRGRERKSATGS